MGFWNIGKEKKCVYCGEETNMIMGSKLKDETWICGTCKNRLHMGMYTNFKLFSGDNIKLLMDIRNKCTNCYAGTLGAVMFMDSIRKCYIISYGVREIDYDEIVGYELLVDNNTVTSGGLGRAAVGGLLFGPVGAVVGGITGGKKTKTTCKKISIKLTVTGKYSPSIDIDFMISENKTDSIVYGVAYKEAQGCLSKFEIICKTKAQKPNSQATSGADEILKYKQLLDMGAITLDEFNAKKKQILGL